MKKSLWINTKNRAQTSENMREVSSGWHCLKARLGDIRLTTSRLLELSSTPLRPLPSFGWICQWLSVKWCIIAKPRQAKHTRARHVHLLMCEWVAHLATDWMTLDEVSLMLVRNLSVPPFRISRKPVEAGSVSYTPGDSNTHIIAGQRLSKVILQKNSFA